MLRRIAKYRIQFNVSQFFIGAAKTAQACQKANALGFRTAGFVLLILTLYWVFGNRPIVGEPWQWADDGLYLRQAEAIQAWWSGKAPQWLGPYDPTLLSKAPLFAVCMALLNWLGIPLRLAEFAGLLCLPFLFRAALRPITRLDGWRFAVCTIFLVGMPFLPAEIRLLRTMLQAVASGVCLIAAVGLVLRAERPVAEQAGWAAMLGFFFSVCYLNREDAIWLLPVVGFALLVAAAGGWIRKARATILIPALCCAAAVGLPIMLVTWLNFTSYGVAFTTERRAPAITRAHQLLTSLEPADREHYVPIVAATRLKAYAVSPTFARLQSYLEGPETDSYARHHAHLMLNDRPLTDREFFVSNFEFVLRDGAFRLGNKSAAEMEKFFQTVGDELADAIDSGRIKSGNHGPAMLAAPMPGDYSRILGSAMVSLSKLFLVSGLWMPSTPVSSGEPADLARMSKMTHSTLVPIKGGPSTFDPGPLPAQRLAVFEAMMWIDLIFYGAGTALALGYGVHAACRWRRLGRMPIAAVALMLSGGLLLFGVSMGAVNVLGFPILKWPQAYNILGFTPLSILSVFGFVLATSCLTVARPEKMTSNSAPLVQPGAQQKPDDQTPVGSG